MFQNIEPEHVNDPEVQLAVTELWEENKISALAARVRRLLHGDDVLGRCAVFDLYSYQCTTDGEWKSGAFSDLLPSLVIMARSILRSAWDGDLPPGLGDLRDRIVASAMHVIWRAVEMEDAPLVLEGLRSERQARVLFPTVWAANLLRGNDETFDRQSAPLLADVAMRDDLPSRIRLDAVDAIGESINPEALQLLTDLLHRLPLPISAGCALNLLDASDDYKVIVREAAQTWPESSEYPVLLVLKRIGS